MADDYQYIDSTGVIVPDTTEILTGIQTEYLGVFGQDLIVTPDTPQGMLITSDALSRTEVVNNNAAVANQINPNIAGGVFLDAILALTGMQRQAQQQTLVTNVTVTGQAGTIIPAGSQAQTAAGDVFQSLALVRLDGSGNGMVSFSSVAFGAIACSGNSLNQVVTSVLGWETVNNNPSGSPASVTTLGIPTQSDQQARALRSNTLAFQGVSLAVAITSALYATTGVTSLSFVENYNPAPEGMLISITGGVTLSGQIWGMTTTGGMGTNGNIIVGTDSMDFAESLQDLPGVNPWPVAAFSTTGNITLSGLGTQGGGDWASGLSAGNIILVKDQSTDSQNGVYLAESGAWTRHPYNAAASQILGSNQGISLIANSIYTCVNGGAQNDVAAALLENKSSGCGWNGNTTVAVVEPASGQSYNVQYDTPTQVPIQIQVTSPNGNATSIVQAILDYAAGVVQAVDQNGVSTTFPGFVVGADVSAFEIAAAIAIENPGIYIQSVLISLVSPLTYSADQIPIGLNEIAFTDLSLIQVVVP